MNDQQRAAMQMALEALEEICDCPQWVDEATIPKDGIEAAPHQVIMNMSVALVRLRKARKTITALREALQNNELSDVTLINEGDMAQPQDHSEQHLNMVQGEPVGYLVYSLDGVSFQDSYCEGAEPVYTTPPSVEAAIERENQLFETFARIADYLCIDAEAARQAEGKPSDVFIKAIEAAIEATKEKAAKLVEELLKQNAAASFFGRGEIIEPAAAIRSMK